MVEPGSLLAISVDTKTIRTCLVEPVAGIYRLVAWHDAPSNHRVALTEQVAQVSQDLGVRLGRVLWNEVANTPLLASKDPARYPSISQVVGAASLHPPLRVWLAALSRNESLAAARRVIDLCQAQIVGQTVLQASTSVDTVESALLAAEPDVVVIVGGYDNPDVRGQEAPIFLSSLVLQAAANLQDDIQPILFFAGNHFAGATVSHLGQQIVQQQLHDQRRDGHQPDEEATIKLDIVHNVRPAPDRIQLEPLAQALRAEQQRLYEQSDATLALSRLLTSPAQLTSIESSFTQFARLWAVQKRLDSLHALYCGSEWWLHVWAQQTEGASQDQVRVCFTPPHETVPLLADWPPLQLVSGPWPDSLWPRPQQHWWDRNGLVPLLATIGQVAPLAMLQVIHADLFEGSK